MNVDRGQGYARDGVILQGAGSVAVVGGNLQIGTVSGLVLFGFYKFLYGVSFGMSIGMTVLVSILLLAGKWAFVLGGTFLWSIHPVVCALGLTAVLASPLLFVWKRRRLQQRFRAVDG